MPKLRPLAIVALGLVLAGCATRIDSAHFGPPRELEQVIRRHYERHASEQGACFRPFIDGFTRFTVLEDSPDRLVVETRYLFRDRVHNGGQGDGGLNACTGFAERTFVLGRDAAGATVVVEMTGDQDEQVLRTLIRRALPGRGGAAEAQ